MTLALQIAGVAAGTVALFAGAGLLVARGLRMSGVKAQLAAMVLRLSLVLLVALGIAVGGTEHRVALLFTVGAAYFAAVLLDGIHRFRRRETNGCSTG